MSGFDDGGKSRSGPRVASVVVAVALAVYVAGLCLQPVTESDLFFRLKVGQEILAHGHLMGRNLFSFTAPDHPDLDLAWAFEVGAALLFRLGGLSAVVVGKTLVILAAFALGFVACRRRGAGVAPTVLALAGAAFVMRERFVERPHVVSFLGEAIVLIALGELGRPWSRKMTGAFAVAMVLWANGHAGVFAGVLMLGAASAGLAFADRVAARRALGLCAVAAASAFATPVGVGLVRYLSLHLLIPRIHVIDEFRTATFRSDAPFFVWVAASAVASAVVWGISRGVSERAPRPWSTATWAREAAPALAMTILGLLSVRFSADAALVLAPLVATRLTALGNTLQRRLPGSVAAPSWLVAMGLLAVALVPRVSRAREGGGVVSIGLDPTMVPGAAIAFVTQNGLRERMYNDFETGSYLAFEGYPRYRVFVDPRLPAYPEDLHRLLGDFDMDRTRWHQAMERYGVTSALLADAGVNRRVSFWDPERWALVFRAANARVFVRRLPVWRDFIAEHEVPATFTFTVEEGTKTWPLELRPHDSPVADCEWRRRLGDLFFELDAGNLARALPAYERALAEPGCLHPRDEGALAAWLGAAALKDQRFDRAIVLLDRAVELDDRDAKTRANRAVALENVGRTAAAAADWAAIASQEGATPLGKAAAARAQSRRRDH